MAAHRTIKEYEAALRANAGQPGRVATELGLTRQSVNERISRSKYLQDVLKDIDRGLIEKAVCGLDKALDAGDASMIRYVLDKKGKDLGFGPQRVEIGIEEKSVEAFIASLGGDLKKYRAAIAALGDA